MYRAATETRPRASLSARVLALHWHEWLIGVGVVLVVALGATVVLYFGGSALMTAKSPGNPGPLLTPEAQVQVAAEYVAEEEAPPQEGDATSGGVIMVEDAVTGVAVKKAKRVRGDNFRRWTRYQVIEEYELEGRLVTGLKDSHYALIRIQPKGVALPNLDQLEEIAESFRSSAHQSTYVYFFLPGMDTKSSPWCTVFQQINRPMSVSFDKTNMPVLYLRYADQVFRAPK
jgi:hypothetical protein